MTPIAATSALAPAVGAPTSASQSNATDQFGLSFESLLKIVLTQLTYQDPLEPMDNFEFVSQLGQFSQIQQTQSMSQSLDKLVAAQSAGQAASFLGRRVEVDLGGAPITGMVSAVGLREAVPTVTITTAQGQTLSGLPFTSINQIWE